MTLLIGVSQKRQIHGDRKQSSRYQWQTVEDGELFFVDVEFLIGMRKNILGVGNDDVYTTLSMYNALWHLIVC